MAWIPVPVSPAPVSFLATPALAYSATFFYSSCNEWEGVEKGRRMVRDRERRQVVSIGLTMNVGNFSLLRTSKKLVFPCSEMFSMKSNGFVEL